LDLRRATSFIRTFEHHTFLEIDHQENNGPTVNTNTAKITNDDNSDRKAAAGTVMGSVVSSRTSPVPVLKVGRKEIRLRTQHWVGGRIFDEIVFMVRYGLVPKTCIGSRRMGDHSHHGKEYRETTAKSNFHSSVDGKFVFESAVCFFF
jgi:hypothetical protein